MKDTEILIFDCTSKQHQIIFHFDADFSDNYKEVILSIHLANNRSYLKRLIAGIKYIFGYKCKYGHFDEIIVTSENYQPFAMMVDFIEKC